MLLGRVKTVALQGSADFRNPFLKGDDVFAAVKGGGDQSGGSLPRASERARLGSLRRQFQKQRPAPPSGGGEAPAFGPGRAGAYTDGMQALRDTVARRWGITDVGGFADRNIAGTNVKSDHAKYRAWDFMVGKDRATGDAIADYVTRNADKYGVKNLIWYDRSWNPSSGWRPYGHPGGGRSDTLQHRDHPHVGFN